MANINIPDSPMVSKTTFKLTPEWLQWMVKPNFQSLNLNEPLAVSQGGTGLSAAPAVGSLLVGTGTGYSIVGRLPASAFPVLAGDITTAGGSLTTTLATVNTNTGSFGDGSHVASFTVNGKGLITAAAVAAITGAPGSFTAIGAFGCNSATAQTSATANAAISATAGAAYTAAEQTMLNDIKALLNQIRAALVANGICV